MALTQYDYIINVTEIPALPSGQRFAAKVASVCKYAGSQAEEITTQFHEHWGHTSSDARSKAEREVDGWIAVQQVQARGLA
ncbi:MAG TPA: hypothetical protein VI485_10525 [Vicinamibacterales bacterium]|nr:hypothetical protein [Vicinamibacterales bacterium]